MLLDQRLVLTVVDLPLVVNMAGIDRVSQQVDNGVDRKCMAAESPPLLAGPPLCRPTEPVHMLHYLDDRPMLPVQIKDRRHLIGLALIHIQLPALWRDVIA